MFVQLQLILLFIDLGFGLASSCFVSSLLGFSFVLLEKVMAATASFGGDDDDLPLAFFPGLFVVGGESFG